MLRKPTFHIDLSKQLSNVVGGGKPPPYDGIAFKYIILKNPDFATGKRNF